MVVEELPGRENTELSDFRNLLSGLFISHPSAVAPLWEEAWKPPYLENIEEETPTECAGFERSAAPSPPSGAELPKIVIRPPTPRFQLSDFSQVTSPEVETLWSEQSEFVWSTTHTTIDLHLSSTPAAYDKTTSLIATHYHENPVKEVWIMGSSWLAMSTPDDVHFARAEALFAKGTYQAGIGEIDVALRDARPKSEGLIDLNSRSPTLPPVLHGCLAKPVTISCARTINLHLLKSCALLACELPDRALEVADRALTMAEEKKIYYMVCKTQLYRGLALMEMGRWRDASFAFTRAANVRGWAMRVPNLKRETDMKLREALVKLSEGSLRL